MRKKASEEMSGASEWALGAGVGGSETQAVALRKLHAVGCRVAPPLRGAGAGTSAVCSLGRDQRRYTMSGASEWTLGAGVGGSETQAVALRKLHAVGCRVAPPLRGAGRGRLLFAVWVETKDVTRLHL